MLNWPNGQKLLTLREPALPERYMSAPVDATLPLKRHPVKVKTAFWKKMPAPAEFCMGFPEKQENRHEPTLPIRIC